MTDPNRHLRTGKLAPWAKGRLRNPPTAEWFSLRRKIKRMHRSGSASYGEIATYCGVARGTVRRWFLPESDPRAANPSAEYVEKMREWIAQK